MKKVVLAGHLVIALFLSGCRQEPNTAERVLSREQAVEVIIEGADSFPKFLAGHWKNDQTGWEFVFDEDGYISSATLAFGKFHVEPGVISRVSMRRGKTSVLEPGPWLIRYSAPENQLLIEIVIKHLHAEMGGGVIEGDSKDVFIGTLYPQLDQWRADWFRYPQYTATTNLHKDFPLYSDPNAAPTPLVFSRVTEGKAD